MCAHGRILGLIAPGARPPVTRMVGGNSVKSPVVVVFVVVVVVVVVVSS